jgi:hypothetical protein
MKRALDDSREDNKHKVLRQDSYIEPLSNSTSPAWSITSTSPAYRPQLKNHNHTFKGCSKIQDYEFLDKLGEGTFG